MSSSTVIVATRKTSFRWRTRQFIVFLAVLQSVFGHVWASSSATVTLTATMESIMATGNSDASSSTTTSTTYMIGNMAAELLSWTGAWKFEQEWFRQKHPWLPGFVANRVLRSTLILTHETYHQIDHDGTALKEERKLRPIHVTAQKAELVRVEGNNEVSFHLEQRKDGFIYYIEHGLGEYRLVQAPPPPTTTAMENETMNV